MQDKPKFVYLEAHAKPPQKYLHRSFYHTTPKIFTWKPMQHNPRNIYNKAHATQSHIYLHRSPCNTIQGQVRWLHSKVYVVEDLKREQDLVNLWCPAVGVATSIHQVEDEHMSLIFLVQHQ
jgi:hypothetical protein